ncbi:hypothetical protein [Planctomicrobium sp. SH664]|uniref:hypothetical protein n=1 Tax=Planctomicrobium sp. SH664 TaxID=3448125 RepID=UPI003F5BD538
MRTIISTRSLAVLGALFLATSSIGAAEPVTLFSDDFGHYPKGVLSQPIVDINQVSGAIQEYHYLSHRGIPLEPWENAICHLDVWTAGVENGKPYLEQTALGGKGNTVSYTPLFITGDPAWFDCTVEAAVTPLRKEESSGLAFRYHTNRHFYWFSLTGGNKVQLRIRQPIDKDFNTPVWVDLASADFKYEPGKTYQLKVENEGSKIRAFVDGKQVLTADSSEILSGKVGIATNSPSKYENFKVTVSPQTEKEIAARIQKREGELKALQAANPQPKLWKKIATVGFGSGRNIRFGDLDGDGQLDILFAKNKPMSDGDAACVLTCLTAVNLDGKILWQKGNPQEGRGIVSNDLPFQIHDVDGDGNNEVLCGWGRQLLLLDGKTGEVKKSVPCPEVTSYPRDIQPPKEPYPTNVSNGDCIAFFNLTGDPRRRDFIVKDRYWNFWAYNSDMQLLWSGQGMLGHYPYPAPGSSDGRDRVAIGYAMWDADGKELWQNYQNLKQHADSIAVGNFSDDPKEEIKTYYCSSDDGFALVDHRGIIERHYRIGHTQTSTVGKFRPDLPGLQYCTISFWRNPGIVSMFQYTGEMLQQEEPFHGGSPLLPINWRGDGQEFILLGGNVRDGGMVDGNLRRVVVFPDDGHPDLTANALDLTGDQRDEIVFWDENSLWIYTQDTPFQGDKIYAPKRNPDYNESNYRSNVSLPHWEAPRK